MMPSDLFKRFGGSQRFHSPTQNTPNIFAQLVQIKQDPGKILDILLQNGKINQIEYNELQPYKNNPEAIARYLMNAGNSSELQQD